MKSNQIRIESVVGNELKPYLEKIGRLRIEVFREFPYLYDGSTEYEQEYLKTYLESPDSFAVLVFDNRELVGCSTGIPLRDEDEAFQKPFLMAGIDPEKIFYCGESILRKKYRGHGIYKYFFSEREQHAKSLDGFNWITFCAVVRAVDHPLKPENYQSLEPIWSKYGYQKRPDLTTSFPWKDLHEASESEKEMVFWIKPLH